MCLFNPHLIPPGMISNPSLVVTYIIIETYTPNFTFLVSITLILSWYDPSILFHPFRGMISEKSFLRGYIYRNKNLLSKFHVSSFSSFSSGLLVDVPSSPILPLQVVILKNPFLMVTYITIGTYIPNFTFLASVVFGCSLVCLFNPHLIPSGDDFWKKNLP